MNRYRKYLLVCALILFFGPGGAQGQATQVMDSSGRGGAIAHSDNASGIAHPLQTPAPHPNLSPIPSAVLAGGTTTLHGSGFTAGSVIKAFVATAAGPADFGPYTPTAWTPTTLTWPVPVSLPLGNGFVTILVVNTDEGFVQSNTASQLLFGAAGLNIPTVFFINGTPLAQLDSSIPTANVETVVAAGSTVTIQGVGYNFPLVNLFTSQGNIGPLTPLAGETANSFQVVVPAGAATGPGSFQVVNNPYVGSVLSNAVSVPIGDALGITSISQAGSTVTVNGTGFSVLSVINFFAQSGPSVVNFGGLNGGGSPNVPLTILSDQQFTFQVPAGPDPGNAYVMVLNPPFIPFSSTTGDPDGAFVLSAP